MAGILFMAYCAHYTFIDDKIDVYRKEMAGILFMAYCALYTLL